MSLQGLLPHWPLPLHSLTHQVQSSTNSESNKT